MKKLLMIMLIFLLSFGIFVTPVVAEVLNNDLVAVRTDDEDDEDLEEEEDFEEDEDSDEDEEETDDDDEESEEDEDDDEEEADDDSSDDSSSSESQVVKKGHIDVGFPNIDGKAADCSVFKNIKTVLDGIYTVMKIAAPVLVIVLSTIDYIKAIANQNADEMKKVNKRTIKRIVIGLVVFFLPNLLDLLFRLFGLYNINGCDVGI